MTARANRAEGGTSGVDVTAANSGGASGNAWNYADKPAGVTLTYATAAAYKGSVGYRIVQDGSGSWGGYLRWTVTDWTRVRHRFYVRLSAYPSQSAILAGLAAQGAYVAEVVVNSSGRLLMVDNQNQVLWSSAATPPLNTWLRIEWTAVPGTTATNGQLRIGYATGDAAFTESFTGTAVDTGRVGRFDNLYVGKLSGTWAATIDLDDLAADDADPTTYIGATGVSAPVVIDPSQPAPVVADWPPPAPYTDAIRSSVAIWYTVDASYRGVPVPGATGLRPVGGQITDTTAPGVRRTLSLEVSAESPMTPGELYDLLAPIGTQLTVTGHVEYTNKQIQPIPMGVFVVDSAKLNEATGRISLTAPDKWDYIRRARFVGPAPSTSGILVRDQLALLIQDAIGPTETVNVYATSTAVMPAVVWEKDRDKALLDLAKTIGAWVYFDRNGIATVKDVPTAGANYWLIDADDDGVLVDVDREQSRSTTYNVVVVSSSAADGELFPVQYVWDDDPASPTYAGTTVPFASGTPFGIVPYYFDSPILADAASAQAAGRTILARVTGLASQINLESVPNPAIDAFDVLDVVTPADAWGGTPDTERHIVDTVTHPLALGDAQHIEGRTTGTEDIGGN